MNRTRISLLLTALFLVLAPTALASNTWYVNGVIGSDGYNCLSPTTACKTIGHAISLASSGDSVIVAAATYTENLAIGISLNVIGAGSSSTIIDGGGVKTVVYVTNAGSQVSLSNVAVQNVAQSGGGIYNLGILTINHSAVRGNFAGTNKEVPGYGGGIINGGALTINNSTISGNRALYSGSGGGIANYGSLKINNSTLTGNIASGNFGGGKGGGIYNGSFGITISSSTISGNTTSSYLGKGGNVYNAGWAILQNSIVANSPYGGNCYGTMTSKGYNLSSDTSCNFNGPGYMNNTNPMLGSLQNNGGPTQTMALPSGSPAVDAGNPSGCTNSNGVLLKTDQRGYPRPDTGDTGGCDIGAYERQSD